MLARYKMQRIGAIIAARDYRALCLLRYFELYECMLLRPLIAYWREDRVWDVFCNWRCVINNALLNMPADELVIALVNCLESRDLRVRLGAVQIIGAIGADAFRDKIELIAHDRHDLARYAARSILEALRTRDTRRGQVGCAFSSIRNPEKARQVK